MTMIKEAASKKEIKLILNIDGIPEIIRADERNLKQVLYNLLSNAVKFTPNGGKITVSARTTLLPLQWGRRKNDPKFMPIIMYGRKIKSDTEDNKKKFVEITVSDSGVGLSVDDIERIFEPFEQVDNSLNRRFEGTGLGLALSRKLIELHGGRIWAQSKGKDKGSNFHFIVPC